MEDNTIIFTHNEREQICADPDCEEHNNGSNACKVPHTKEEAERSVDTDIASESNFTSMQASTSVVWADDDDNSNSDSRIE